MTLNDPQQDSHRFTLGNFECMIISDGCARYRLKVFFDGAPHDLLEQALENQGQTLAALEEKPPTPINNLVIHGHGYNILIDTGLGPDGAPEGGNLRTRLNKAGITPDDIDLLILTHAHPDHSGGLVTEAGKSAFPNARIFMSRTEWDFWHNDATQFYGERLSNAVNGYLDAVKPQINFLRFDEESPLPGITMLPAPGHTPGQMAVLIESNGSKLLSIADVIAHPLHLNYPTWNIISDVDKRQTINTRFDIIDRALMEKLPTHIPHFPFPGLVRIVDGDSTQWASQPLNSDH